MYTNNTHKFANTQYLSKRKHINTITFYNHYRINVINTSTDGLKEKIISHQKETRKIKIILCRAIWGILFVALSPLLAYPATLAPLKVKCEEGQKEILLPIELKKTPAEQISGIQFDIVIPFGTKITKMDVAESAQKANKMVSYNQIKTNTYRTIVAGLNQQTISDGTILFVTIIIEDNTLKGKHLIKLLNAVLADPEGNSVNCTVLPGEILLSGEESAIEIQNQTPSQTQVKDQGFLNLKNIRIIFLFAIVALIFAVVIGRWIIKNKKPVVVPKKQSKKQKK